MWVIMETINPTLLQLALELAAGEAYQDEVIDTEMEDVIIGEDGEFATPEDWTKAKVQQWIDCVGEKFKLFHQMDIIEINEKTITTAHLFYKLKLGETININKDVVITRVPGGWIWIHLQPPKAISFIPYNEEFLSTIQGDSIQ